MCFNVFIYLTTLSSNMKQSNCLRLFHIKGSDSSFRATQSLKIQEAGWGHTTLFSTFWEIFSTIDHCTSFHRSNKA